jgi:hypothetical protein
MGMIISLDRKRKASLLVESAGKGEWELVFAIFKVRKGQVLLIRPKAGFQLEVQASRSGKPS